MVRERRNEKKNHYRGISLDELLTKKKEVEINLRESYSILIDFIKEFEGDFIPENDVRFSNYQRYRIQIYEIDNCLPLTKEIDFSMYDEMNEQVEAWKNRKNSEHIKNECERIRDGKTEKQLIRMVVGPREKPYSVPVIPIHQLNIKSINDDEF